MISPDTKPLVTVIGAGVSGLSAAHELVERGYKVQVVDPRRGQFDEYSCEVGGLAATQYGRIKETRKLYPEWYMDEYAYKEWREWNRGEGAPGRGRRTIGHRESEEAKAAREEWKRNRQKVDEQQQDDGIGKKPIAPGAARKAVLETQKELVLRLRSMKMQSISPIVPFKERILFRDTRDNSGRALPDAYEYERSYKDYNEVSNDHKMSYLGLKFLLAIATYRMELQLAMLDIGAGFDEMSSEVKLRETLLIELIGRYALHSDNPREAKSVALKRAASIRQELVNSVADAVELVQNANLDDSSKVSKPMGIENKEILFAGFVYKLDRIGPGALSGPIELQTEEEKEKKRKILQEMLSATRQFITDTVYNQDEFEAAIGALSFVAEEIQDVEIDPDELIKVAGEVDHQAENYLIAVTRPDGEELFSTRDLAESSEEPFIKSDLGAWIVGDRDRVDFEVVQHIVAGEHGFRLFPAWYRNLFDTMRRTPILERDGRASQDTMLDQLRTPPETEFSIPGKGMVRIPKGPEKGAGAQDVNEIIRKSLSLTRRDTFRMVIQSLKFQTSGDKRRKLYEEMSWLRFVDGRSELDEQETQSIRPGDTGFSEKGEKFMREFPQALVAMRPEESDARTFGSVEAQVGHDFEEQGEAQDQILNGPTSDVWLRHWKRYLRNQGVHFYAGSLKKLHGEYDDRSRSWRVTPQFDNTHTARGNLAIRFNFQKFLAARVPALVASEEISELQNANTEKWMLPYAERGSPKFRYDAEYFVLAVPYQLATEKVAELYGSLRKKQRDFEFRGGFRDLHEMGKRTGCVKKDGSSETLTCGKDGRTTKSWSQFPVRQLVGVQFFYSHQVQVGASHVYYYDSPWALTSIAHGNYWLERPSSTHGYLGHLSIDVGDTYNRNSEDSKFFWECDRQEIADSTLLQVYDGLTQTTRDSIANPSFFHVDDAVPSFRPEGAKNNQRTFQKSGLFTALPGQWKLRPDYKEDSPIEYSISYGQWVFAGNHMPTYTRLATMEAANESGRHAVAAIVQHAVDKGVRTDTPPKVWNPEEFEPGNFDRLKELDDKLMEKGLPHFLDILGALKWIDSFPHDETPSKLEMMQHLADAAKSTTGMMSNPAYEMAIRQLGRKMDQMSEVSDSLKKVSSWFKSNQM